jgi:hypothetical protein
MTYQPTGNPVGRPTIYTDDLAQQICDALVLADCGLYSLVDTTPEFPSGDTVWKWQRDRGGFAERITRARERQMERLMYRSFARLETVDPDGGSGNARVSKARAVSDLSMRLAGRIAPHLYGDRQRIDVNAFRSPLTVAPPSLDHLTPEEISAARALAAKALMRPAPAPQLVEGGPGVQVEGGEQPAPITALEVVDSLEVEEERPLDPQSSELESEGEAGQPLAEVVE